jgi:phosphate:Na+ symporter
MGQIATTMLADLPGASRSKDQKQIDAIINLDDKVDILEAAIFAFLGKIRQQPLTEEESKIHQDLMTATINIESIADIVETELSSLIKHFIDKEREMGENTRQLFVTLHHEVLQSIESAVKSIRDNDQQAATEVFNKKKKISQLSEDLLARKSKTIGHGGAIELETARIEISLVDKFLRAYSLAKRIAVVVLPPEVTKEV